MHKRETFCHCKLIFKVQLQSGPRLCLLYKYIQYRIVGENNEIEFTLTIILLKCCFAFCRV